jgi:hypothetical protein
VITLMDLATIPRNDLDAVRELIKRKGWPTGDSLRAILRMQDSPELAWETIESWRGLLPAEGAL